MGKDTEQKIEYKEYNKIYMPSEYINNNYKYTISGDEITIITNNNCYNNYNNYDSSYNTLYNHHDHTQNYNNYNTYNNTEHLLQT